MYSKVFIYVYKMCLIVLYIEFLKIVLRYIELLIILEYEIHLIGSRLHPLC